MSNKTTYMTVAVSYGTRKSTCTAQAAYTKAEYDSYLTPMTHIFRNNFWEVFSGSEIFEAHRQAVEVFGLGATVSRVVVLHSAATDFDGLEAQDYVIGFVLGFDTDIAGVVAARARFLEDHAMSDHYHTLMAEVLGPELSAEFSCTPPAIPGRSSHLFEAEPTQLDLVAAATLAAYFHYGWIILLRLERAQMELRITDGGNDVLYSSAEIIRQRVRLINIKRQRRYHA